MLEEMYEMLETKLNIDCVNADYRPFWVERDATEAVSCTIKIALGTMKSRGIGMPRSFDHRGWIFFDFGTNEDRPAEKVTWAMDELIDWIVDNYEAGVGYTYGGTTIRDLEHVPFQSYPQPREQFAHDMIMVGFWWERI